MRWTVQVEGGPRRVNHAVALVGDVVYSLGGYCSAAGEFSGEKRLPVYALDTVTLRWSLVRYHTSQHAPRQRYGHTAVSYKNKIYMWGGRDNHEAYDTLSILDVGTLDWTTAEISGPVPFAKDGHSACLIQNRMYIFGGFEFPSDMYSQQVHYIDLDTFRWTLVDTKGRPPSPRDFHTAVAIGNRMYIYGGRGDITGFDHSNSDIYDPEVYYLDTIHNVWVMPQPLGDWPEGRRSHSAWVYNGDMYIFGGYNLHLDSHFNDIYRYSPKDNNWSYISVRGKKPCKRRRQACVMHENKLYMFGGTSPANTEESSYVEDGGIELMIDNSDLNILDCAPMLRTLCILTVLEKRLDQSILPLAIRSDIKAMTLPNTISKPITNTG